MESCSYVHHTNRDLKDILEVYFLNGHPRPLCHLFSVFSKQTIQILQLNVKKCPSSIRRWDSNTQPSDYEPPPLTTRPGLSPAKALFTKRARKQFWCIFEALCEIALLHFYVEQIKTFIFKIKFASQVCGQSFKRSSIAINYSILNCSQYNSRSLEQLRCKLCS